MSELLRCSSLCGAEVVVENVPPLSSSQHALIRNILQKQLHTNVPILEVEIMLKRWIIKFYRREDATRAQQVLQGYLFRNRVLQATVHEKIKPATIPYIQHQLPSPPIEKNPNWGTVEWADIMAFKGDLHILLTRFPEGISIEEVLAELRPMRRRGIVTTALDFWPTGIIRMFAPQVRMTGRYLSLADQGNLSSLMRKAASEGTARAVVEQWEPMLPTEIRFETQFIDYLVAILAFFGPQHIEFDVPIRILADTLSAIWPKTAREIAAKAIGMSPHFVLIDDVLYLTSNIRHRRLLLEHVQPTSNLKNLTQRNFGSQ